MLAIAAVSSPTLACSPKDCCAPPGAEHVRYHPPTAREFLLLTAANPQRANATLPVTWHPAFLTLEEDRAGGNMLYR